MTPPATVVIPAGSASGSPLAPWKAPVRFGDVQVVGGMWEWVGVVPAEGSSPQAEGVPASQSLGPWGWFPVNPERSRRVPAPFGFLCKKSMVSLADVVAAGCGSSIAAARLLLCSWVLRKTAVRRW